MLKTTLAGVCFVGVGHARILPSFLAEQPSTTNANDWNTRTVCCDSLSHSEVQGSPLVVLGAFLFAMHQGQVDALSRHREQNVLPFESILQFCRRGSTPMSTLRGGLTNILWGGAAKLQERTAELAFMQKIRLFPTLVIAHPVVFTYILSSLILYCVRRAHLHSLTTLEVLRRHFDFAAAWRYGFRGLLDTAIACLVWLVLFIPSYPVLELMLFPLGLASFFFYYPDAHGFGLIVERPPPRTALRQSEKVLRKPRRKRQVLRLEWHRFSVNVGERFQMRCQEQAGRKPPAIELNLPHVEVPSRKVRHWPWRQHADLLLWPYIWYQARRAVRIKEGESSISRTLDRLHQAAKESDSKRYLDSFSRDATFMGTDASERWPVFPTFARYVRKRFEKGDHWDYSVKRRSIVLPKASDSVAWFDEDLWNSKLGRCRGTGVVVRERSRNGKSIKNDWKVSHYSLTMLICNDCALEVANMSWPKEIARDKF